MTNAELKTLRESLGLTAQWLADQANVKIRTVQYWEAGDFSIPQDVARLLIGIDDSLNEAVKKSIESIDNMIAQSGAPESVALIRYRTDKDLWRFRPDMKPLPCACHATLLSRLRRKLWERGIPSVIEYMEPVAYLKWLGDRKDTEATRSEWVFNAP